MFFEGSEKKVEVVVEGVKLRALGVEFWAEVVKESKAQILSTISSNECDAYLLSESSLFVWDDKFVMITCGETTLAHAVDFCFSKIGSDKISFLTYQRKNEYYPEKQKTNFFEDVKILTKHIEGTSVHFGEKDGHHLYLFTSTKPYEAPVEDVTLEILMYGLQGESREIFNCKKQTLESLRAATDIDQILPDYKVDDFLFDPCGYSLNAVSGADYYTIHVTPQDEGAYVSFETNAKIDQNYLPILQRVIKTFNPRSFDVVVFRSCTQEFVEVPGFVINSATKQTLESGYCVNHCHFDIQELSKAHSGVIEQSTEAVEIRGN